MKILDDIEPEAIFKSILWTVFIGIFTSYFVLNYILPVVNDYKKQKHDNESSSVVLSQVKAIYNTEEINLNTLVSNNKDLLNVFHARTNMDSITNILNKHFKTISISQVLETNNKNLEIKETKYKISGKSDSLENIMNIPEILQKNNISATLTLPISINKQSKKNIVLDFTIHILITKSTYKHTKNIFK